MYRKIRTLKKWETRTEKEARRNRKLAILKFENSKDYWEFINFRTKKLIKLVKFLNKKAPEVLEYHRPCQVWREDYTRKRESIL